METGCSLTVDMNDELVEIVNSGIFNQSYAILKVKYYNPPKIFSHIYLLKNEQKNEVIRKRNGYFIDTFTSVDLKKIKRTGGRLVEIYEGVI